MATDTDAARDGVLAARAELDEELRRLNASTRCDSQSFSPSSVAGDSVPRKTTTMALLVAPTYACVLPTLMSFTSRPSCVRNASAPWASGK